MTYCKNYCEETGISTSQLINEAQRTLYYIAENMKMDKSISEEGYEHFQQAIKALGQEPILDKIRAKIMQLDYGIETIGFDLNDMPADEMVHTICREEVLKIIDKYKAKGEVEK